MCLRLVTTFPDKANATYEELEQYMMQLIETQVTWNIVIALEERVKVRYETLVAVVSGHQ